MVSQGGVRLSGLVMTVVVLCAAAVSHAGDDPEFVYRFKPAAEIGRDAVYFNDGTIRLGRAVEWGTCVYLYDAAGHQHEFSRDSVKRIDYRTPESVDRRPNQSDLTVSYIAREPADFNWHGDEATHGTDVKFTVHLRNAGAVAAPPFAYRVLMDELELMRGATEKALPPGATDKFEVAWKFDPSVRRVVVELDIDNKADEISEWNNRFIEPIAARGISVVVEKNLADAFMRHRNLVDTYNFDDWIQHHVRLTNRLFAASVWPQSPQGIAERVRIAAFEVRDPRTLPGQQETGRKKPDPLVQNLPLEFDAIDEGNAATMARHPTYDVVRDIGLRFGLVDRRRFEMSPWNNMVRDGSGEYLHVGHRNADPLTMMDEAGPRLFAEADAIYLNRSRGLPHGFAGEMQYLFPTTCSIEVRDGDGRPLGGVRVELFERPVKDNPHGQMTPDPVALGTTDAHGQMTLPNRDAAARPTPGGYRLTANPFGAINLAGDGALLMARLTLGNNVEHHFIPAFAFNAAAMRGQTENFTLAIRTQLASGGPTAIDYTRLYFTGDTRTAIPLSGVLLRWPHWGEVKPLEYRVFDRHGHDGHDSDPWRLVDLAPPQPAGPTPQPHESLRLFETGTGDSGIDATWLAVAPVDGSGRVGALSESMYVPARGTIGRLAITADQKAFIPASGDPEVPVLLCNVSRPGMPLRPYGLRGSDTSWKYRPVAAGAALDALGQLVLADPIHDTVAWYDRGVLTRLVGDTQVAAVVDENGVPATAPAGQFDKPSDVAIDERGRVYVADRMNHRIQRIDGTGSECVTFGTKGKGVGEFDEPFALGCANGFLCVTEWGNSRVQVFDVSGDGEPAHRFTIANLIDPDRALVSKTRRVYLCEKLKDGTGAILVYAFGSSAPEQTITVTRAGTVRRPRGLYDNGSGFAFFACDFPFQVMFVDFK